MTGVPIGRAAECRRIDELVDRLPGQGGALVMCGEAGLGKAALVDRAVDRAADGRIHGPPPFSRQRQAPRNGSSRRG